MAQENSPDKGKKAKAGQRNPKSHYVEQIDELLLVHNKK